MKILILIVFISITLFSCDNTQKDLLLNVNGKPGEIVVVIEKNTWTMSPGKQLKRILTTVQPALPQDEPMFRVYHIEPSNFSVLFKSNRNIIYVEKGDFLRLNNVKLGYQFSQELCHKLSLQSANLSISARKLFTFTKYSGQDPEVGQNAADPFWVGVDYANTPPPKNVTISFAVGF